MSYASRNNGKITNRPSGGGSSKAGLHPTATHFYIASSTGNNYYIRGRNSLVNNNNCTNDPSTIKKIFVDFTIFFVCFSCVFLLLLVQRSYWVKTGHSKLILWTPPPFLESRHMIS